MAVQVLARYSEHPLGQLSFNVPDYYYPFTCGALSHQSMSFGFSVGDFFAVGSLIVKIVEILRGSRSEYQELIRELEKYARSHFKLPQCQLSRVSVPRQS